MTLRTAKKNFEDEQWLHDLFLTTVPKTKIGNVFANYILRDRKLTKVQLSKSI